MHTLFEAGRAARRIRRSPGSTSWCGRPSTAGAADVLGADGYLLGTPANLGYISGALKHFFDQIYYPCLERDDRPAVRAVRARQQRHRRRPEGRRGDHDRAALASGPPPGVDHRRATSGRHRRVLGARRHARARCWPRDSPEPRFVRRSAGGRGDLPDVDLAVADDRPPHRGAIERRHAARRATARRRRRHRPSRARRRSRCGSRGTRRRSRRHASTHAALPSTLAPAASTNWCRSSRMPGDDRER